MSPLRRLLIMFAAAVFCSTILIAPAKAEAPSLSENTTSTVSGNFLHDARIKYHKKSTSKRLKVCKNAHSATQCAEGSPKKKLKRGKATPKGEDWDMFWHPAHRRIRIYVFGLEVNSYPQADHGRWRKISGCAGCTKTVRVSK